MYNYILVTAVLSWCVAQVLKTIINLIKNRKFSVERLFGAGGWPSAHSAMVCSATAAVARVEGFDSTFFGIMAILALITMYDAMGVRHAAGEHAKQINKLNHLIIELPKTFSEFTENFPKQADMAFKDLKEYLGHTPFEVVSGAILGFALAFVIPMNM